MHAEISLDVIQGRPNKHRAPFVEHRCKFHYCHNNIAPILYRVTSRKLKKLQKMQYGYVHDPSGLPARGDVVEWFPV
jgi:hypothetical protein